MCLPSDALLQHLPSCLGFSYLGCGVSLHGCSSKVQPLLLTLDAGYLLTATPPDLKHGIAPLGPSCAHTATIPWMWGCSFRPLPLSLDAGLSFMSPLPFLHHRSLALSAAAPDLGRGVTPLGHCLLGMRSSRLLPLTSDVG